jgi:hypothetical protein
LLVGDIICRFAMCDIMNERKCDDDDVREPQVIVVSEVVSQNVLQRVTDRASW